MSLEAVLAANTESNVALKASLDENNRLLAEAAEGRERVIAAAEKAQSTSSPKKPSGRPPKSATETPAADESEAQTEAAPAAKSYSEDDLKKMVGGYAGVDDEKVRAARTAEIKRGLAAANAKFGTSAARAGELTQEGRDYFGALFARRVAGEVVPELAPPAPSDDDLV